VKMPNLLGRRGDTGADKDASVTRRSFFLETFIEISIIMHLRYAPSGNKYCYVFVFQFVYKVSKLCDGVLYSKYQCRGLVSRYTLIQNGALLYYLIK